MGNANRACCRLLVLIVITACLVAAQSADEWQKRGEDAFRKGDFTASVAAFDKVLALVPRYAPEHWQRGISLYYAGRFKDCKAQFASHRAVNPEDVENAVFHMLCAARVDGFAAARGQLIPVASDSRPPMREVHALFAGIGSIAQVMGHGRQAGRQGMFYAFLYIGYFEECAGRRDSSRTYFREADRLAGSDYMGDTARVHWKLLRESRLP